MFRLSKGNNYELYEYNKKRFLYGEGFRKIEENDILYFRKTNRGFDKIEVIKFTPYQVIFKDAYNINTRMNINNFIEYYCK